MTTKEEPKLFPAISPPSARVPPPVSASSPPPIASPASATRKLFKSPRRGAAPAPHLLVDVEAAHSAAAAAAAATAADGGGKTEIEIQVTQTSDEVASSMPDTPPLKVATTTSPDSPCSSSRKGKGGRKAANPHLTEEERRRERVLKNRESAMKSLQKKKRYTEDLEHRAVMLANRNSELKEKIRLLLSRLNAMNISNGVMTPGVQLGIPAGGMNGVQGMHALQGMQGVQAMNLGGVNVAGAAGMQGVQDFRGFAQTQQVNKSSRTFCQMDEWAPPLDMATSAPLAPAHLQQAMPLLGESFMSGVNLSSLALPNVVPTLSTALPVSEGFIPNDADKISAGFDMHMTCSQ